MKAIRTTYKLPDGRELVIKLDGELVVTYVGHFPASLARVEPMTRYEITREELAAFADGKSGTLSRETRRTISRIAAQAHSRATLYTKETLEKILTSELSQHAR